MAELNEVSVCNRGWAFVISRVLPPEENVLFAPIAKKEEVNRGRIFAIPMLIFTNVRYSALKPTLDWIVADYKL